MYQKQAMAESIERTPLPNRDFQKELHGLVLEFNWVVLKLIEGDQSDKNFIIWFDFDEQLPFSVYYEGAWEFFPGNEASDQFLELFMSYVGAKKWEDLEKVVTVDYTYLWAIGIHIGNEYVIQGFGHPTEDKFVLEAGCALNPSEMPIELTMAELEEAMVKHVAATATPAQNESDETH